MKLLPKCSAVPLLKKQHQLQASFLEGEQQREKELPQGIGRLARPFHRQNPKCGHPWAHDLTPRQQPADITLLTDKKNSFPPLHGAAEASRAHLLQPALRWLPRPIRRRLFAGVGRRPQLRASVHVQTQPGAVAAVVDRPFTSENMRHAENRAAAVANQVKRVRGESSCACLSQVGALIGV